MALLLQRNLPLRGQHWVCTSFPFHSPCEHRLPIDAGDARVTELAGTLGGLAHRVNAFSRIFSFPCTPAELTTTVQAEPVMRHGGA